MRGLLYGGGGGQLAAQVVGTLTSLVFVFAASWAFFMVLDAVLRVPAQREPEGLDVPEMGVHGYPEVQGPSPAIPGMAISPGHTQAAPAHAVAAEPGV